MRLRRRLSVLMPQWLHSVAKPAPSCSLTTARGRQAKRIKRLMPRSRLRSPAHAPETKSPRQTRSIAPASSQIFVLRSISTRRVAKTKSRGLGFWWVGMLCLCLLDGYDAVSI